MEKPGKNAIEYMQDEINNSSNTRDAIIGAYNRADIIDNAMKDAEKKKKENEAKEENQELDLDFSEIEPIVIRPDRETNNVIDEGIEKE